MAKLSVLKDVKANTGTFDNRSVNVSVKDIPIGDIRIKENIRVDYIEIDELTESIRRYGLLQPITIYAEKDGYIVKTGHRRFLAYQKLFHTEPERFNSIRCIISDANNTAVIQLVENVQRVDLSQIDLLNALNGLKAQGMTLKQIAEIMGKTEGYIKSLFVGVNEINRDKDLQNLVGDAGITIRDIAETNSVTDKKKRIDLLKERKNGSINRATMRKKVKEIQASKRKTTSISAKQRKIHISIKAFPTMNKIIIYQLKVGNKEEITSVEEDLKAYFQLNKEKYCLIKNN